MRNIWSVLLGAAILWSNCAPVQAATVSGSVPAGSVVWISGGKPPAPVSGEMHNISKSFAPPLLIVPVGSSVRFPNDDPFYHSIYSTSKEDPFDIGFYGTGPGKPVVFSQPGVIDVHCHIHSMMHGTIVVVDGAYTTAESGKYTIGNLAAGRYTMHAWDLQHGERKSIVRVPAGNSVVTVDLAN